MSSVAPKHKVDFILASRKYRKPKPFSVKICRKDAKDRVRFILKILVSNPSSLSIRFCDNEEMQETNLTFRGKNKPTDVLSFPSLPGEQEEGGVHGRLGDLLVCLPVCKAQSLRYKRTLAKEVEKMLLHGIVHLIGLDHERSEASWKVMTQLERSLERELVKAFGEPNWLEEVQIA